MSNKVNSGITFGKFIKVCFGRKILMCIIAIAITICSVLLVEFGINKNKEYYTATFQYDLNDLNQGKYQYGGNFHCREILLEDNIEKIKEGNELFSDIDVQNIVLNPLTSIKNVKKYDNSNEGNKVIDSYFVITLPKKAFSSEKQAREFIKEIVDTPNNKNIEMINKTDYLSNIKAYEIADSYESQVFQLINQVELIMKKYDSLIEKFGNYVLDSGVSISEKKTEVQSVFNDKKDLEMLYTEIKIKGYVKSEEVISKLETRRDSYQQEFDLNTAKLKELTDQRSKLIADANGLQNLDLTLYNEQIISLTNKNIELKFEIDTINNQINNVSDATEFEKKLDSYKNKIVDFTNELTAVEREITIANSNVFFNTPSVISVAGGFNLIMVAVMFLILGVFAGAVVNLIIDYKKLLPEHMHQEEQQALN